MTTASVPATIFAVQEYADTLGHQGWITTYGASTAARAEEVLQAFTGRMSHADLRIVTLTPAQYDAAMAEQEWDLAIDRDLVAEEITAA